jgi:oxygen-independent coproporphyrinogen-3 oxidase
MKEPIAVYVHIPFCPSKCGYCDFNSYAMEGDIVERTVQATIAQIEGSPLAGRPAETIFFGGGTPTFIPVRGLLSIFEAVCRAHPPQEGIEISSEANPGTVDASNFGAMRNAGFNRISIGGQSFLDEDLIRLGRVHKSGDIERAVQVAREAGFQNINLDLMFGLSDQSPRAWKINLARALSLNLEHLSLYCLTIEPNTAFYKLVARDQLSLPNDDIQVEMYHACCRETERAGFEQYEISNFSKPGRQCHHNLHYWHGHEYAGYGPGAVASYLKRGQRIRATSLKHPVRYCEAIEQGRPVEFDQESLDEATLRTEKIMLGLRLNQGLSLQGCSLPERSIEKLTARGWVERTADSIRLTEAGRDFCSEVALELI